ncbi:MAG: FKBP-type peptidyl-prolyl cis-trans isomerase [Phycisphaeraceae bacterium]|nr:MAG: FKBP-type peptidyl-prolyl cis-trans isomerase [Phycisphaeraceae bacterium]
MAEAEVNGRARTVSLDMTNGAHTTALVYADDAAYEVRIDMTSGEVVSVNEQPDFSLPGEAVEGEPTVTESGLMYYDIEVGDGQRPAGPQSTVSVHYTGWLVDGTQFDSSRDRGQPASFPLGQVIPGWTEGVGGMRVGGKRKLIIPYGLGYGEQGAGGVIPPRAMLIFDVELLNVDNAGRR